MVAGRSTEPRTVTATLTSGQASAVGAAGTFSTEDVGRTVTGTGVPANATILSVNAGGDTATLSANASASGSKSLALGAATDAATGYHGWSPESAAEATTYSVAANNAGTVPPGRITDTTTGRSQRGRG